MMSKRIPQFNFVSSPSSSSSLSSILFSHPPMSRQFGNKTPSIDEESQVVTNTNPTSSAASTENELDKLYRQLDLEVSE